MFLFYLFFVMQVAGQTNVNSSNNWIQNIPNYLLSGYTNSVRHENGLILGAATLGSLASLYIDERVNDYTLEHDLMPEKVSRFSYEYGAKYAYILALTTIWVSSRKNNDKPIVTKQKLCFAALTFTCTELTTAILKAAVKRIRPNDSSHPNFFLRYSFPSGHASGSFAVAAVVHELFGTNAGIGAYLLAGLVALSRIHDNEHYLSDVLFGAGLGVALGRGFAETYRTYRMDKNPLIEKISINADRKGVYVSFNIFTF